MLKIKKAKLTTDQWEVVQKVGQIDLSESEVILIEVLRKKDGSKVVDIRKWYSTAHGFKATRQGFRLDPQQRQKLAKSIKEAKSVLGDHDEK